MILLADKIGRHKSPTCHAKSVNFHVHTDLLLRDALQRPM